MPVPYTFKKWTPTPEMEALVKTIVATERDLQYKACASTSEAVHSLLSQCLEQSKVMQIIYPIAAACWDLALYLLKLLVSTITGLPLMDRPLNCSPIKFCI